MYYTTIIHPIRKSLHLSCNEYCVLDSIYKLQNNESHWCYKSRENMAKDLDLSKQTIITIIKNLVARGLVMQNDVTKHLRVTNEIFPKLLNDHKNLEYNKKDNSFTIGIETLPDESKNFTKSGKETLPYNNIYIDNNNTNKIYNEKNFTKPTPKEVSDYAKEINFNLDGEYFCDYNEARGWLVSKNPMKDWKAAVRTWKKNSSKYNNDITQTPKIKLK